MAQNLKLLEGCFLALQSVQFSSKSACERPEMPWFLALQLIGPQELIPASNLGRPQSISSLGLSNRLCSTSAGGTFLANRNMGWTSVSSPSYYLVVYICSRHRRAPTVGCETRIPFPLQLFLSEHTRIPALGFVCPGANWGEPDSRRTCAAYSLGDGSSPYALHDHRGNSFLSCPSISFLFLFENYLLPGFSFPE